MKNIRRQARNVKIDETKRKQNYYPEAISSKRSPNVFSIAKQDGTKAKWLPDVEHCEMQSIIEAH